MYSDDDAHIALLPNGFYDLLFPQTEKEAKAIEICMKTFARFGYKRTKPPLIEFEESLLSEGPGSAMKQKSFRVMDPVSQRMMAVRPDVTTQISRIGMSRLSSEKRPLRLSYAGDVLRVKGTQLRPERQYTQVGCELIGSNTIQHDVEACLISLKALSDLNIKNVSIDLTLPGLVTEMMSSQKLSREEELKIRKLISKRDRDALRAIGDIGKTIADLIDCTGYYEEYKDRLLKIALPENSSKMVQRLVDICDNLLLASEIFGLNNYKITLDPLEGKGFHYQKGIGFTLFSKDSRAELGRGGHYDSYGEQAIGFTLYTSTLTKLLPDIESDVIDIPEGADWEAIKTLQDKNR